MNKRRYLLFCIFTLLLILTNLKNDKYYMNYQLPSLNSNNATEVSNKRITIEGDGTNERDAISVPHFNLPKGEYRIMIQYKTDTDANFVRIDGQGIKNDLSISEELDSSSKKKEFYLHLDEDTYWMNINIHFCGEGEFVLKKLVIESTQITNTDTIVWLIIIACILTYIGKLAFYNPSKESQKKLVIFLSLLTITIFASYPLFNNYLLGGHDISFHLSRIEGIKNALLNGQFPIRVHPSTQFNYGYAAPIFYPEVFLFIPAILRIFGVSLTGSIQIFIIMIHFVTAWVMYFSVYKLSKVRSVGIVSSMIYTLASYHLCDVYVRFALGEALAMAFLPLLIYGVYELFWGDDRKWPYVVIGTSCIMQSHVLTTLLSAAFVGLVAMLGIKKVLEKNRLLAAVKAAVLIVLLNLWYLVPFVSMMKEDTKVSTLSRIIEDKTINVMQLFQGNGMLEIGLPIFIGVAAFIYCLVMKKIEDKKQESLVVSLLALGILSAFITTNLFPWKILVDIPIIGDRTRMIQFPWRLLVFATVFLSIVAAYGLYYFVKAAEVRRVMMITTFAMLVLFASLYLKNNYLSNEIYCYKGEISSNTGTGSGEYFYNGTISNELIERGEAVEASSEKVDLSNFQRIKGKIYLDFVNSTQEEQYIEVPLMYYPFYSVKMNHVTNLQYERGENNVLRIIIPSEAKGSIIIKSTEKSTWMIADLISLLTIAGCVVSLARKQHKIKEKGKNELIE
ncbi:hypothetical protein [Lachnotalea glycerini]|uniref:Membrane protein 6-pyruvoyl-tetrahydropterin synthase-related domain-containing protein n=1 Tax=Lachnotalea glycerini TaxID=1763509 RepID=A0A371JCR6_9FIRM|nr:hypothetical protein [Lachnotalea glycerini]RDY30550.1 hypothetical protein CG710_014180 [Lachnotalea glycerini]